MNDPMASDNPGEMTPSAPGGDANAPVERDAPHDAVGAYLLDALPEDERRGFERHLAGCADCQREVAALRPVVVLLPIALDADVDEAVAAIPDPAPDLRDRILAAARADETDPVPGVGVAIASADADGDRSGERSDADVGDERAAPAARPRGRIRPGFTPGAAPAAGPTAVVPWTRVNRANAGWLAAAAVAVVALGALTWALLLQGRLDDRRDEIRAQQALIDQIRQQANATAYTLSAPTGSPSAGATGSLLFSLRDRQGVLLVQGLTPLPADRAYQMWFITGTAEPEAGQTFQVNDQGEGVTIVGKDVPTFDQVALTAEPRSGSPTPTSAIVLVGSVGGAAG